MTINLQWVSLIVFVVCLMTGYLAFHPSYKLQYFQNHKWEEAWIDQVVDLLREEWKHYSPKSAETPSSSQSFNSEVCCNCMIYVYLPCSRIHGLIWWEMMMTLLNLMTLFMYLYSPTVKNIHCHTGEALLMVVQRLPHRLPLHRWLLIFYQPLVCLYQLFVLCWTGLFSDYNYWWAELLNQWPYG